MNLENMNINHKNEEKYGNKLTRPESVRDRCNGELRLSRFKTPPVLIHWWIRTPPVLILQGNKTPPLN